jgi:hypothetical protein
VEIDDIFINPTVTDTAGVPPTVQIVTPESTQLGLAGRPLLVRTNSTDDVGVSGVEIFVNDVSETGLPGGMARGVAMMPTEPGAVTITAIASDFGGNLGMDSVTIQVIDAENAFTISPTRVVIGLGETVAFEAMLLSQDVTDQATWFVNGIEGGNPGLTGSISTLGVYDTTPLDVGAPAVYRVRVQAEMPLYPGFRAEATVEVVDSRNVVSRPVAFSFPAPGAPGGLLVSRPVAFSFPAPSAPGGLVVSRPIAFSFPAPGAPGGLVVSKPISFERQLP